MTDKDYNKLIIFEHQQGLFEPYNANARDLTDNLTHKEKVYLKEVKARDVNFHRAYFALLSYIYDWLSPTFKQKVPKTHFYNWLKMLLGNYKTIFEFSDGQKLIEYDSIAFGNMSQKRFEEYVRNQLPMIYDNVIHTLYDIDKANDIIENIEETFKKYLSNL